MFLNSGTSVETKTRIIKLFLGVFTGFVLIHAVSTLPFYVVISRDIEAGASGVPYAYIALRLIRFGLCLAMALAVRKRCGMGDGGDPWRKRACLIILAALAVFAVLCISGWGERAYFTVSHTIGIYDRERVPLWLAVFWEQIFSVDLAFSALLGFLVVGAQKLAVPKKA